MIRVSCLVIRENHKSRVSCLVTRVSRFVFRKDLEISGLRPANAWEALIRDPQGTVPRRLRELLPSMPGRKKQD